MRKTAFISLLVVFSFAAKAQKITPQQYIEIYKDLAIAEMIRTGIPASVTLAQGLLETESGNSELVKMSNNHFGIKCKKSWTGESVSHTDDAPNECFRKYSKAEDSYKDHSDYLKSSPRYASLFTLDPSDYKGWAYGLKRAGYATNPRYPQILITNIEKYNLQQYDNPVITPEASPNLALETAETIKPQAVAEAEQELSVKENNAEKKSANGLKCVFANKGTSLLAVATKADVPLLKLLEYNDLAEDGLLKNDQWLYLEKKLKQGKTETYTTTGNESLYEISQSTGVQLQSLSEYNKMSPSAIVQKGTVIKLRSQSATASK